MGSRDEHPAFSNLTNFPPFFTLSENLKFCPKNQFSEKMKKIWIFVPKINDLWWFLYIDFLLDFEFSPKIVKIQLFSIFDISVFDQNRDFLARKFNIFRYFFPLIQTSTSSEFWILLENFSDIICDYLTVWFLVQKFFFREFLLFLGIILTYLKRSAISVADKRPQAIRNWLQCPQQTIKPISKG